MKNNVIEEQLKEVEEYIKREIIIDENGAKELCQKIKYINRQMFLNVCNLYGYPLTVIYELKYTDKMYRDAYYIYLSHLHFDIDRHCQRLALFSGEREFVDFFDVNHHETLQEAFLGTMVIRPSYNQSAEYTMGRTLLNPYKLKYPFKYIRTARYSISVCGQIYNVDAFPFSNQHGGVLRCAETSVWSLMEYYGTRYESYSVIMPSTITNWASKELPQRSLPSYGLTYSQISSLLKTFKFEPRIYERASYWGEHRLNQNCIEEEMPLEKGVDKFSDREIEREHSADGKEFIFELSQEELAEEAIRTQLDHEILDNLEKERRRKEARRNEKKMRLISFRNLFHYYVESGMPLITAVCNSREDIHHSIVIIGHGERSISSEPDLIKEYECFEYDGVKMIDSSVFYERYITIDDNQYPYRSERFDHFTINQNCIVEAFIVPLYRHIMLDAESAVNIIETLFVDYTNLVKSSLQQLEEENPGIYCSNSIDNPVVLRYYLTTSRSFVDFRNKDTEYLEEKIFYDTTSFPKFIWVGEYSTLELYREGKILGEVILDATAPKYSGVGAIISLRFGGRCVSRNIDESIGILMDKLRKLTKQQARLTYNLYTNNLQKGDF